MASSSTTTTVIRRTNSPPDDQMDDDEEEDDFDVDLEDDDLDFDDEDYLKLNGQPEQQPQSRPNTQHLRQLISLNLKLFQDNFRLKKFCTNFQLYLEKYCQQSSTTADSMHQRRDHDDDVKEIYRKFEQNYGNIQWQLFNDYAGIKTLIDKLDPVTSDASSPGGLLEQHLFKQTQSLLASLEHDPAFEESLLDSLLEGVRPVSTTSAPEASTSHNLRRRSSLPKSTTTKLFTCHFCTATFSFVNSLIQHLVREHESAFQCFACGQKFRTKATFAGHFRKRNCFAKAESVSRKSSGKRMLKKSADVTAPPPDSGPFTCSHCALTFKRATYLKNHIKGVHPDEAVLEDQDAEDDSDNSPYYCCLCKQSFRRSIYLVDHIKATHTENVCVSCNKQFKVRSCLNRHIKESSCGTQRPQRSYPCTFCNFPFKRITHLNQHILRKHSSDPSLELVFESYHGSGSGERKSTEADADEDIELLDSSNNNTSPITCTPCRRSFSGSQRWNDFFAHLRTSHLTPDGQLQCVHCLQSFKTRSSLVGHFKESSCTKNHASAESDLNDESDNDVDLKENGETEIDELRNKVEVILEEEDARLSVEDIDGSNSGETICKWPGCNFTALDCQQLLEHRKLKHLGWNESTSTYNCTHCPRHFTTPSECFKHLRHDHQKAKYRCNFKNNNNSGSCDFETIDLALLREHKATKHVQIRCYTCDWANCGKTFVNRSLVAHHIRIVHKNERLHPCVWPGCEQSFKRPINLRHHMATHTGQCNYHCPVSGCEQSFRNPGSLYLHRRRHEQQKVSAAADVLTSPSETTTSSAGHCCTFPGCSRTFFSAIQLKHHQELDHSPGTPVSATRTRSPVTTTYAPLHHQQIIQLHSLMDTGTQGGSSGTFNSSIMSSQQSGPSFVHNSLFRPVNSPSAESTISTASSYVSSAPGAETESPQNFTFSNC